MAQWFHILLRIVTTGALFIVSLATLLVLVNFVIRMHLSSFANRLLSLLRLLKMDWGPCTDTCFPRLHLVYGRTASFHSYLCLKSFIRAGSASSYFNLFDQKPMLAITLFNYIKLCSFSEVLELELIYCEGGLWGFITYTNLLVAWWVRETFRFINRTDAVGSVNMTLMTLMVY